MGEKANGGEPARKPQALLLRPGAFLKRPSKEGRKVAWGDVLDRNSRPFLSLSAFLFSGCLACQGVYKPLAAAAAAKRLGSQTVTAPPTQAGRLLLSLRLYIRTDKQTDKQTNRQASSAVTCRSPFRVRPDFFSTFFFSFSLSRERGRGLSWLAFFFSLPPSLFLLQRRRGKRQSAMAAIPSKC